MSRTRILVSACLLGQPVRYDGSAKAAAEPVLARWRQEGRLVSVCPELAAGFAVPRPPAEIAEGRTGADVLAATARVIEQGGRNVTDLYLAGAYAARDLALAAGCRFALLTDGSPSCGSTEIHGGGFDGARHSGEGVTAAVLAAAGITVVPHHHIDRLIALILADDARYAARAGGISE